MIIYKIYYSKNLIRLYLIHFNTLNNNLERIIH